MVRAGARSGSGSYVRKVWRCPSSYGCGRVSIDADGLEALLTEAALLRMEAPEVLRALEAVDGDDAGAELVAELDRLDGRLLAAAEGFAAGRLSAEAYERSAAVIEKRRATLRAESARRTKRLGLSPFAGRSGTVRAAWATLGLDQRRGIISMALGSVVVLPATHRGRPSFDQDRVRIGARSPIG
jgi:hypothetical protein